MSTKSLFGQNLSVTIAPITSLSLSATTESTSTSTGAFVCSGGAGIAKSVNIGGSLRIANTVESTTTSTGSVILSGGLGVAKSLSVGSSISCNAFTANAVTSGLLTISPVGRIVAATNGGGSELNYYRNTNQSIVSAGDFWAIGHNAFGAGDRTFALGCNVNGIMLRMDPAANNCNIYSSLEVSNTTKTNRLGVTDNIAIGIDAATNPACEVLIHSPFSPGSSRLQFTDNLTGTGNGNGFLIMKNDLGHAIIKNQGATGNLYIGTASGNYTFEIADSGIVTLPITTDSSSTSTGAMIISGGVGIAKNLHVGGTLTKAAGAFVIDHPNPAMVGKKLRHSFVESNTRGDNIYRFKVHAVDKKAVIQLPDYFPFLNEDVQVFCNGSYKIVNAIGIYDESGNQILIESSMDTAINVLVLATRKDKAALAWWGRDSTEVIGSN